MPQGSQSPSRLGYASHPLAKEYNAYRDCIKRCSDPNTPNYSRYGGRGIGVDPSFLERREGFRRFLACVGKAPTPAHSLDRIVNSRGYVPGNLRWATPVEQSRNRDYCLWLCLDARAAPLMDWADETGIPASVLRDRLREGWDEEKALRTPYTPRVKK